MDTEQQSPQLQQRIKKTHIPMHDVDDIAFRNRHDPKFIADISDIIKAYIKNANPVELVNLSKSSFYMRKFNHSKDLYSVVHAECITRFNSRALPENIIKALKSVYSSHGIMNDSPFAEVKLKRN